MKTTELQGLWFSLITEITPVGAPPLKTNNLVHSPSLESINLSKGGSTPGYRQHTLTATYSVKGGPPLKSIN